MTLLPTPSRHFQLEALFARQGRARALREAREPVFDDSLAPAMGGQVEPGALPGRQAAEMALAAGEHRLYTPRQETQVLEMRSRR